MNQTYVTIHITCVATHLVWWSTFPKLVWSTFQNLTKFELKVCIYSQIQIACLDKNVKSFKHKFIFLYRALKELESFNCKLIKHIFMWKESCRVSACDYRITLDYKCQKVSTTFMMRSIKKKTCDPLSKLVGQQRSRQTHTHKACLIEFHNLWLRSPW